MIFLEDPSVTTRSERMIANENAIFIDATLITSLLEIIETFIFWDVLRR